MNKRKHGNLDCLGCGFKPTTYDFECPNYKIWWEDELKRCCNCKEKVELVKNKSLCKNCFEKYGECGLKNYPNERTK